jgi:hypothetical protein
MTETTPDARTDPSTATGLEAVREHREDLQDLAESDLPVAGVAETLLEAANAGAGE